MDVMIQTVSSRLQVIIKQRKTKIASRQIFFETLGSSILTDPCCVAEFDCFVKKKERLCCCCWSSAKEVYKHFPPLNVISCHLGLSPAPALSSAQNTPTRPRCMWWMAVMMMINTERGRETLVWCWMSIMVSRVSVSKHTICSVLPPPHKYHKDNGRWVILKHLHICLRKYTFLYQ